MSPANGKVLLDANVIIDHFNSPQMFARFREFSLMYVPSIVLGELYYGAFKAANSHAKLSQLNQFAKSVILLSVDPLTAEYYGRIKIRLKSNGTPIPENDIWIAALAQQYRLPLLTHDKHMKCVSGLTLLS